MKSTTSEITGDLLRPGQFAKAVGDYHPNTIRLWAHAGLIKVRWGPAKTYRTFKVYASEVDRINREGAPASIK